MIAAAVGILAGLLVGLTIATFGVLASAWIAIAAAVVVIAAGARDYVRCRGQEQPGR